MPGLFGLYLKNRNAKGETKALLTDMANSLKHYEMYALNTLVLDKFAIGKFDINSNIGEKVYVDPKTKVACGLYGQIYDYINIDNSILGDQDGRETEKIIKIYNKYGIETPKKLNGEFNIVVHKPQSESLFIFNDRFGFRHLYYYEDSNIFAFAPEIKSLLTLPHINKSLDEHGIADYFNYSYHMGNRTMFKYIKVLPPASCLCIQEGNQLNITTYWEPVYKNERGLIDIDESVNTGYKLFLQSLNRCVGKSKNALIPISGGLDSRLIIATAKNLGTNITPITFGIKGCLDYKIAKRVCKTLNLKKPFLLIQKSDLIKKYFEQLSWFNEANYSGLGLTTQYAYKEEMGVKYDCFLNGIFGGHLSFGSPYFNKIDLDSNFTNKERIARIIKGLNGDRYSSILKKCCSRKLNDISDSFRDKTIEEEWKRTENVSDLYAFRQDALFLYNRIRRGMNAVDQNRFFYNDQLPYASYELFEFYLSLAPDLMLNHFLYKEIFKKKLPHLAKIPWQSTGVNLYGSPSKLKTSFKEIRKNIAWYSTRISRGKINIIDRDKDGHPDINYRKDGTMRKLIENILFSDQCLDRGFVEKDGLKELLEWEMKGGSAFPEISKMVVFEVWARNFLD